MTEGNLPLVIVCSRRGSHPKRTLGGLYMTDLGVVIGYSEGRGIAYRRVTATGNRGKTFYETDDRTVLEFRCHCGLERHLKADRFVHVFNDDDTPLMRSLDISRISIS